MQDEEQSGCDALPEVPFHGAQSEEDNDREEVILLMARRNRCVFNSLLLLFSYASVAQRQSVCCCGFVATIDETCNQKVGSSNLP